MYSNRKTYTYTTQRAVRAAFWKMYPHDRPIYRLGINHVEIRCAFVDFVDYLHRSGDISDAMAQRVTL